MTAVAEIDTEREEMNAKCGVMLVVEVCVCALGPLVEDLGHQ